MRSVKPDRVEPFTWAPVHTFIVVSILFISDHPHAQVHEDRRVEM